MSMFRLDLENRYDPSFILPGPRECIQTRRCNLGGNGIDFESLPVLDRKLRIQDSAVFIVDGVAFISHCVRSV